MRNLALITCYLFCCVGSEARQGSSESEPEVDCGTLVRWPKNFKGDAVVPHDVRHIGIEAFTQCKSLTGVKLPDSLETVGAFAFSGCVRLKNVSIPETVTNIGSSAFFNCQSLTSIVVRAAIGKIPENMCARCLALKNVELPLGTAEISDSAFSECRSIESISMPESVKKIGRASFKGCGRMSSILLPGGLKDIADYAFYGCYDMKYVILKRGLNTLGASSFRNCVNLRGIVLEKGDGTYAVFPVLDGSAITADDITASWSGASYDSVEKALAACGENGIVCEGEGMFNCLNQALRMAADGLVDGLPDTASGILAIDVFAANISRLMQNASPEDVRNYFSCYSMTSVDVGDRITAKFDYLRNLAITAEFNEGKLSGIELSEELKTAVRAGMSMRGIDENVVRWLQ